MSEIVSLFTVFSPHLSAAALRQLCEIAVFSMRDDAKYFSLDFKRRKSHDPTVLQHTPALGNTLLGVL